MKLVECNLGIDIDIIENKVNVIAIEHQETYRFFVGMIINQINGNDGSIVLSEDNNIIAFKKYVEIILDPFSLDLNSRKIQTRLFQLIKSNVDENLIVELSKLNNMIHLFLEKALCNQPYSTSYNLDIDLQSLLKMYHVGFEVEELNFFELLIEYIRIQSQLMDTKVLMFLNLKNFISENELKELYKFAFYCKINVVLLESTFSGKCDDESILIIDSDRCIIEI